MKKLIALLCIITMTIIVMLPTNSQAQLLDKLGQKAKQKVVANDTIAIKGVKQGRRKFDGAEVEILVPGIFPNCLFT